MLLNTLVTNPKFRPFIKDIYSILQVKYNLKLTDILANQDRFILSPSQIYDIELLPAQTPIEYITNKVWFYDICFDIKKPVLIPRLDSEVLVEALIKDASKDKRLNIIELGCGSGALILSILKNLPLANGFAIDKFLPAILNTKQNAIKLEIANHRFVCKKQNFQEALDKLYKFDIIISNPPYIKKHSRLLMQRSVTMHESHLALFAESDGLLYYRVFFAAFASRCKKNTTIYLEIGFDIYKTLLNEISKYKNSLRLIQTVKDSNGIARVLVIRII
jgi:release factor glutamine methyltransferase